MCIALCIHSVCECVQCILDNSLHLHQQSVVMHQPDHQALITELAVRHMSLQPLCNAPPRGSRVSA